MVDTDKLDEIVSYLESILPLGTVLVVALSEDQGKSMQLATNSNCPKCICEAVAECVKDQAHKNHSNPDATGYSIH